MTAGVLLAFVASLCMSASNLIEKHAVDRLVDLTGRHPHRMIGLLLSSRVWLLGFGCGLLGVALAVVAFSLSPIAVAQSIMGVGLCILVFASRLVLRETMHRSEYFGLATIVVAVVLISLTLTSSATSDMHPASGATLIASTVTTAVAAALFAARRRLPISDGVVYGVASGLVYGVATLQIKGASVLLAHYGLFESLPRIARSTYPYVFILESLVGLVVFQSGLQQSRVTVVAPLTNIIASAYVVAMGMALYGDTLPSRFALALLRIVGFALVLTGTWILAGGAPEARRVTPVESR